MCFFALYTTLYYLPFLFKQKTIKKDDFFCDLVNIFDSILLYLLFYIAISSFLSYNKKRLFHIGTGGT